MAETGRTFWILALAAAALSASVWCTVLFPTPEFPYRFQGEIHTATPTTAQIYYERGAGLRDSESAKTTVAPLHAFTPIDLPLPGGKYRVLHFSPTTGSTSVRFRNARIATFDGRVVRTFAPTSFVTDQKKTRLSVHDHTVEFTPLPNAIAADVTLTFQPPLRLGVGFWSKLQLYAPRWIKVFGLALAALLVVRISWIRRDRLAYGWKTLRDRRPRLALAIVAAGATALASYPIIFFGKSLLSPTSGSVLLYDGAPTLPGFADLRADDVHRSDVGAMMWQHLPYTVIQHRALAAGELPLWNRYNSTGNPLLGQGQSMFGDPFHWPVIAAGGAAWAFDAKFIWAKLLFACGVGWCVWLLTRDFAASALAILASAFVGFFSYRFNHPAIFSLGYAPWILVGWLEARSDRRRGFFAGSLLWFAANFGEITSGTVKEAYVLCLALNLTGLLTLLLSSLDVKERFRRLGFISVPGLALVLMTAPIWWSFFHTLRGAYTAYDVPVALQIRREWFIGFFDDLFYREMTPGHGVYMPSSNFLVFLGCCFAVLQPGQLWRNRTARSVAIVAVGAFLLAFQTGSTEAAPHWMLTLPLFRNLYHVNNLFSCVALVLVCVLSGWGFSQARGLLRNGRGARCVAIILAALVVLLVPYLILTPPGWTDHRWHAWAESDLHQRVVYGHVLFLPLALGLLIAVAAQRSRRGRWTALSAVPAVIALAFVLVRHGQHLPFFAPNEFLTTPGTRPNLFAPSAAVDYLADATAREPGRVLGLGNILFPGYSSVYGLEGINGPDALVSRRYRELGAALGLLGEGWQMRITADEFSRLRPVLEFLNVSHVVTAPQELKAAPGYQPAAALDLDIWRSEHVWPRAFFVNRIETYATLGEFVGRIREGAPRGPFAAVQSTDLTSELKPLADDGRHLPTVVPGRQYRLRTNQTSFSLVAPSAGIAVLQEAWLADDFVAKLDGKPVPYFRINHAFKGVLIPTAGPHQIEFSYRPCGFSQSVVAAAAGIALLLVSAWSIWRFEKAFSPAQTTPAHAGGS